MLKNKNRLIVHEGRHLKLDTIEKLTTDKLILYLHGLGSNYDSFTHLLGMKNLSKYSEVAVSMIGFGNSDKPNDFSYKLTEQVDILFELLNQYEYKEIYLVLHSSGGAVGVLLAEKLDERLSGIVNMEGNLLGSDCGFGSRGIANKSSDAYLEYHHQLVKELADNNDPYADSLSKTSPQAMYLTSVDLVDWSNSGKLMTLYKALDCRKIYIYGNRDKNPVVLAELKDMSCIEIKEAGHAMHCDQPKVFYDILVEFITLK